MELKLTPEIIKNLSIKIDNFVYLWLKYVGEEPNFDKSVELMMEGYIYAGGNITKKGKDLVESIIGTEIKQNIYDQLHKDLQNKLVSLTNKKQVKANGEYTFLCNSVDLKNKLSKVTSKYKLKDWERVKKLLLLHVEKSYKQGFNKVMLVQYYIEKNGTSTLASDYLSFVEKDEITKTTFEI